MQGFRVNPYVLKSPSASSLHLSLSTRISPHSSYDLPLIFSLSRSPTLQYSSDICSISHNKSTRKSLSLSLSLYIEQFDERVYLARYIPPSLALSPSRSPSLHLAPIARVHSGLLKSLAICSMLFACTMYGV